MLQVCEAGSACPQGTNGGSPVSASASAVVLSWRRYPSGRAMHRHRGRGRAGSKRWRSAARQMTCSGGSPSPDTNGNGFFGHPERPGPRSRARDHAEHRTISILATCAKQQYAFSNDGKTAGRWSRSRKPPLPTSGAERLVHRRHPDSMRSTRACSVMLCGSTWHPRTRVQRGTAGAAAGSARQGRSSNGSSGTGEPSRAVVPSCPRSEVNGAWSPGYPSPPP